jgi:Holliday junction DNA helicase RuvA
MIGHISGTVCDIDEKSITVDVAGVGYEVLVPVNTLFNAKEGQEIHLHIHTHVREDQITLFGFIEKNDRALFKKLLSVSGVGPKTALNVLSVSTPSSIIRAIENGKSDLFPKVPGLGKKTIEKIILDLKGKFEAHQIMQNETEDMHNARMALDTLGYNARDINEVLTTLHPDLDMHSIIRESLKILSKSK